MDFHKVLTKCMWLFLNIDSLEKLVLEKDNVNTRLGTLFLGP
jgi:hypothetical protein